MRILFFLILLFPLSVLAQVSGLVTDPAGEPLPFVSVYYEGSTVGSVTNVEGRFELAASDEPRVIVFRFIGYQTVYDSTLIETQSLTADLIVSLEAQAIDLTEVNVVAGAEDPAYAIIRKAMEVRQQWLDAGQSFSCRAYMKSLYRFTETPDRIMGTEIGDLGGILDTNGQGIIYLSESESDLYMDLPGKQKEVMRSSKVSGSDDAFSFNRASLMNMNFYKPTVDLGRSIISPIAAGAFFYYRYRLEGTFFDEQGRLINKIAVLPKREEDPTFSGFIYITEDLWNIQSVDFRLTGKSMKQPIIDTLLVRQVYIPVDTPNRWMPFDQSLSFSLSIFGFEVEGYISTQFSRYELNPEFPAGLFSAEVFTIEEGANAHDSAFWEAVRPVPLTHEELNDYSRKDSLQAIWESKPYMDSLDRENNRFTFSSLLSGHTWSNSWERRFLTLESPLSTFAFNPVQGVSTSLRLRYRMSSDKDETAYLEIEPALTYGLTDKQLRGRLRLTRQFNAINYARVSVSGGREITQLNSENPVNEELNNIYALFSKTNFLKLYEKWYGRVEFRQEVANGLMVQTALEYADRRGLVNATEYSLSKKDGFYAWNDPFVNGIQEAPQGEPFFDRSRAFLFETSVRIRFAQKYWRYPNRKVMLGSAWPELTLKYRTGIRTLGAQVAFHHVAASLKGKVQFGLGGTTSWFVEGGFFPRNQKNMEFIDRMHFIGNQMVVTRSDRYLKGFLWLPYYAYSTDGTYAQAHTEHHFEGFLLDKIPLIRKLGWKAVAGVSLLQTPADHYLEWNVGAENIGFLWLRILRADVVFPFPGGTYGGARIVLSVGL